MNSNEYRVPRTRDPRRERRILRRKLFFALTVVGILLLSWAITAIIERGSQEEEPTLDATSQPVSILAPLPFEHSTFVNTEQVHDYGPVQQSGAYSIQTMDYAHISLAECGQVSTSYFSDAAFLGDSITQGFTEYSIEMSGALICGYVGASPNSVVNRSTMNHSERGEEIILDVLTEAQPAKLYVLLGANALTNPNNDDSFLAYYSQMLDMLQEALPNTIIYVQALTPVQASVTESQPGLNNARFQTLNQSLAAMAYEKGCEFLDLYSAFVGENGELNADYAQPDGLHFTIQGYEHWVDYLCRHTVYSSANAWLTGSAYAETTLAAPAAEESGESAPQTE